ncbi:MAG: hypothetical protein MZU97_12955 [Bacillus subtilis]|nr:hypothetical protein [Bacillus subtilis]
MFDFDGRLDALRRKDEAAFKEIYEQTKHGVYAGDRRDRPRPPRITEDLVQDTYMKMLSHLDGYEPGRNFNAWLVQIAKNLGARPLPQGTQDRPRRPAGKRLRVRPGRAGRTRRLRSGNPDRAAGTRRTRDRAPARRLGYEIQRHRAHRRQTARNGPVALQPGDQEDAGERRKGAAMNRFTLEKVHQTRRPGPNARRVRPHRPEERVRRRRPRTVCPPDPSLRLRLRPQGDARPDRRRRHRRLRLRSASTRTAGRPRA